MNNPAEYETNQQKLAALFGDSYRQMGVSAKVAKLSEGLNSLGTWERLERLERAFLEPPVTPAALIEENRALKTENAELRAKAEVTDTAIRDAVETALKNARAAMVADVERLAEQRAVEIMALVGQPMPTASSANSGVDADTVRVSVLESVAEKLRARLGIS